MIRPLRRRHRWLVPTLLVLALGGVVLALTFPVPSARVDQIPSVLVQP